MCRFTYQYRAVAYESTMEHYLQDGEHRYRVVLPDGSQIAIAKFGMSPPNAKIIWLQAHQARGEVIQPLDLVQAIGEGLEEYKLSLPD